MREVWRGRRVVMAGDDLWMQAMLEEMGVQIKHLLPETDVQTMCRTMQEERVHALILPCGAQKGRVSKQLSMVEKSLMEAREAGIPLTMMYSDISVYQAENGWMREQDQTGGRTRAGLVQSVLQLYADGVSRGLEGDSVQTLIIRQMPCMDGKMVDQWCSALQAGRPVHVIQPNRWNIFQHPLDAASAVLALGARYLSGKMESGGVFNIGTHNVCTNREAASVFAKRYGGSCLFCEDETQGKMPLLLDGTKAQNFCLPPLSTQEALDYRMMELKGETRGELVRRYLKDRG